MEVDVAVLLGAIIENTEGPVELPFEVLQRVMSDTTERGITVDVDEAREVLILGVTAMEDIELEDEQ